MTYTTSARILLGDSHRAMRRTLRAAVEEESGWSVCGEAVSASDLLAKAVGLSPDVVVMDVGLIGTNPIDLVRELRSLLPSVLVLVVSVYESAELAVQFRQAGASGYVLKPDVGHALATAIQTVLQHETFFRVRLQSDEGRHEAEAAAVFPLTAREREVLRLLAAGESNKQVAAALKISVNTVETHRARIMSKLDLHSMSALVRYALRKRLIDL